MAQPQINCPLCSCVVRFIQISYNEAAYMCSNAKCVFPIGMQDQNLQLIRRDYKEIDTTADCDARMSTPDLGSCDFNLIESILGQNDDLQNISPEDIDEVNLLFEALHGSSPNVDCDNFNPSDFWDNFNNAQKDLCENLSSKLVDINFDNVNTM